METKEIKIPAGAKIRVYWSDKPENYSKDNRGKIKKYFANKYGVPSKNINVVYKPVKLNKNGELIEIDGATIDNIMNIPYQRELFKEWLDRESKDVDFKHIIALDNKINSELDLSDNITKNAKYKLKSIELNNFLSFGTKNVLNIEEFEGLTVVNSTPQNQGGKSTLTIDAIKFLFFGKTTKTDTAAEIFNTFTDKDEVTVGGEINIDGEEYIIERKLFRKKTKTGNYKTSSELNFFRVLSDGSHENLEGEQRRETDKLISETIGTYDDFMLTIVATAKNLEDLLETKPTQRGRLLTKFIGLEIIEKKEEINKGLMSDFKSKMKSNVHNTKELEFEIEDNIIKIKENKELIKENNNKLFKIDGEISEANSKKEILLSEKYVIDDEVSNVNPKTLKDEIDTLTDEGVTKKKSLDDIIKNITKIGDVDYDEDKHEEIREEEKDLLLKESKELSNKERKELLIKNLEEGEICPTCKRALEDVDHSEEIKEEKKNLKNIKDLIKVIQKDLGVTLKSLDKQSNLKTISDEKDKLELSRDRLEVEIDGLRVDLKEKMNLQKNYERNIEYIEKNRNLESKILGYNQLLEKLNKKRDGIRNEIQDLKNDNKVKKQNNIDNQNIIEQILREEEVLKIFEIYNRMIGKNGISKLVLSSVIPIINYELDRLLDEVCDFQIQLEINDKNEVDFNIVKKDVTKKLKSGSGLETTLASLALRCVLGRISTLPKPNIIVFDEVLGKVANINLDYVKIFFDKIKKMYEVILLITHNPITQDWGDKIITIEKNNDVSSLQIK